MASVASVALGDGDVTPAVGGECGLIVARLGSEAADTTRNPIVVDLVKLGTTHTHLVRFPATRYQGSKRKLAGVIVSHLRDLEFTTVLDV